MLSAAFAAALHQSLCRGLHFLGIETAVAIRIEFRKSLLVTLEFVGRDGAIFVAVHAFEQPVAIDLAGVWTATSRAPAATRLLVHRSRFAPGARIVQSAGRRRKRSISDGRRRRETTTARTVPAWHCVTINTGAGSRLASKFHCAFTRAGAFAAIAVHRAFDRVPNQLMQAAGIFMKHFAHRFPHDFANPLIRRAAFGTFAGHSGGILESAATGPARSIGRGVGPASFTASTEATAKLIGHGLEFRFVDDAIAIAIDSFEHCAVLTSRGEPIARSRSGAGLTRGRRRRDGENTLCRQKSGDET